MILRAFLIFASLTAGLAAESKTELGEINGAPFRIDMPESWNGGLVMFCHGYSATPVTYPNPKMHQTALSVPRSGLRAGGNRPTPARDERSRKRCRTLRRYGAISFASKVRCAQGDLGQRRLDGWLSRHRHDGEICV